MKKIIIQIPNPLYNDVKKLAVKIGLPIASLVSMMITDTLLSSNLVIERENRKLRRAKTYKVIHIMLDEYYCEKCMLELLDKENEKSGKYKYTQNEFILDCIKYKLAEFNTICKLRDKENEKRRRINTEKEIEHNFSKDVKEKYKKISPLEAYIRNKATIWGVNIDAIKKYYLAKQINAILEEHEYEQTVFANEEETI